VIAPTGGHSITCGYRDDINLLLDSSGRADGIDGCRQAVRHQVQRGADFIKFVATGGVLTDTATGTGQQFFADEFEAIIATAHMLGRRTTAHAHGADGIKAALKAGVDSIEHGSFMDDEAIELMLTRKVVHVPTTLAGATVAAQARDGFLPEAIRKKALEVGPQILQTLSRSHKAGIRIAFGTDSGVSRHGENANEFALMVEAGMTPMEAIAAATDAAAAHIGCADQLGTIEPGKFADIIAVARDPLKDIRALCEVSWVMKSGVVYKAAPNQRQA
jgi:imidazolonepropionase-like amidohydrolase